MKNRFPAFSATAMALACAAAMLPAKAATVTWIGPNASFWDLAVNWNPALPGATDDLLLGAFDTTFRSGTVTVQSFTGTGTLSVTGGSLSATAASSTGGLNFSAGAIGGAGNLGIAGPWNWTGGLMTGAGTTFANGAVNITGAATKQLSGNRIVNLAGTTTWGGNTANNNNVLQFAGATLNNTGTFNDQNGFASFIDSAGGTNAFNNVGTYNKQSNTVTSVPIGALMPSVDRVMMLSVIAKSFVFVNTQRPSPRRVGNSEHEGMSSPSGSVPGVLAATVVGVGSVCAPAGGVKALNPSARATTSALNAPNCRRTRMTPPRGLVLSCPLTNGEVITTFREGGSGLRRGGAVPLGVGPPLDGARLHVGPSVQRRGVAGERVGPRGDHAEVLGLVPPPDRLAGDAEPASGLGSGD